ncbi:hypothetical protein HBI56_059200 [Parastagonospora nodorum]|nr:hypothetical protein HBH98_090730 [Parastagonospora nodorum]KAH4396564.1 hypothetical protein HBH99_123910 [Parastagonospora nodorum]KAH5097774.1 hypothetical protein HBH72_121510 [Parastagonospora nodorum]KAH5178867.1 hypothetical protein HBH77_191310 [Parastagonospora nodorum]KAH5222175.1 hypothetical protein HBI62_125080 [Parastagonospora nodorum]
MLEDEFKESKVVTFKSFASGCKRLAGVRQRDTMGAYTQPSPGIVVNEVIAMRPVAGVKRRYDDQGEQAVDTQLSFVTQSIDGVRFHLPEFFGSVARFHSFTSTQSVMKETWTMLDLRQLHKSAHFFNLLESHLRTAPSYTITTYFSTTTSHHKPSQMAPLNYIRLNAGLSRLLLDTTNTLPYRTRAHKRLEIQHIVNEARDLINVGRYSPGQIKHKVRRAIDDVLKDVEPPSSPIAPVRRITKKSAVRDASVKKRSFTRREHTCADIACAKALLELVTKSVVFP